MHVLILNNVPAPYFFPLFEKIGRESGWRLTVCYSSSWNPSVGWREGALPGDDGGRDAYRTIFLDRKYPRAARLLGSFQAAALGLARLLWVEKPDYLICYGYTLSPQIVALVYAMVTATPFALAGDANYFCDRARGLKRWVKGLWLRLLIKQASAAISAGTANRMFWESYGARPGQLFDAGFAVDNNWFRQQGEYFRASAVALRAEHHLEKRVVFLYVGRLVKRKNVDLILEAFKQLEEDRAGLIIAGAGPEREALESIAGNRTGVLFAGGVAPEQLPLYYAAADALVLAADQEPWGLVINEAMASGLAILAHRYCGATVDLVSDTNGVVLEELNSEDLARAMRKLIDDPLSLPGMKSNSIKKIKNWSIERAAYGMIRAVEESAAPDFRFPIPRI